MGSSGLDGGQVARALNACHTATGRLDVSVDTFVLEPYAVRRLTPRECERLQGLPEVAKHVLLRVCSDPQNSAALAETPNRKWQSFASNADGRVSALFAPNVEHAFGTPLRDLAKRAAVSARIDLERGEVLLSNGARDLRAKTAGDWLLSVPADAFVRAAVAMTSTLASATQTGAAAPPPSTTPSTHQLSGSGFAVLCGRETSALAADAATLTRAADAILRSTTSRQEQNSRPSSSNPTTSSFFVAAVMSGFIQGETHEVSSYDLSVEVVGGWTLVPNAKGKPMADSPRYKMIGNAWAVAPVRWIGERIALVDAML